MLFHLFDPDVHACLKNLFTVIALAVGAGPYLAAHALPISPVVVNGSAGFQLAGSILNITLLSPQVVINWNSFSIGAGETVKVAGPDDWGILNRVVGIDPSLILGNIATPANFGLINPFGILAGSQSSVHAGDVLLSSVNVSNVDFIAQAADFTGFDYQWTGTEGPLVLDGLVDATAHSMYLAAPTVNCTTCILIADTVFIDTVPALAPIPSSLALLFAGLAALRAARRLNRRPVPA